MRNGCFDKNDATSGERVFIAINSLFMDASTGAGPLDAQGFRASLKMPPDAFQPKGVLWVLGVLRQRAQSRPYLLASFIEGAQMELGRAHFLFDGIVVVALG
jgi:hypothetical protein